MSDEDQVEQSAEETDEVEEETTGAEETETFEDESEETESSEESSEQEAGEGKFKKAFEDQKKRAEKAEAELKKLRGQKPEEKGRAPKKEDQIAALTERTAKAEERATRAELAAGGWRHPDDQKYILDAAKRLGVEPLEAAGDELVAGKLKRMGEARATKDATPPPTGRGGKSQVGDVGKIADKVAAGGELPSDPALAEKVQKELARRSQNAA